MGLSNGAQFPADALEKFGVAGEKAVIFFFGQDDAPSCSKQIAAFDANLAAFKAAGVKRAEKRGAKVAAKSGRSKLRKAMTVISATNTLKAAGAKYAEKRETAKAADKTGE